MYEHVARHRGGFPVHFGIGVYILYKFYTECTFRQCVLSYVDLVNVPMHAFLH